MAHARRVGSVRLTGGLIAAVAAAAFACPLAGCRNSRAADASGLPPIDLLDGTGPAAIRPAEHAPDLFVLRDVSIGGQLARALIVPQPSRMAWTKLRIPARARLTGSIGLLTDRPGAVGAPAVFVIGISDDRFYELLLRQELDAGPGATGWHWLPIDVDLSEYGGWKWSLFYQPSRKRWSVTVSVYGSGAAAAALADLAIRVR